MKRAVPVEPPQILLSCGARRYRVLDDCINNACIVDGTINTRCLCYEKRKAKE
jgi:hypothetical protein